MSNQDFIDALERRAVVQGEMAERLRAKAAGDHRITPDAVLKYLVKKQVISQAQASELKDSLLSLLSGDEEDVLNLAPIPEDQEEEDRSARRTRPVETPGPTASLPPIVAPPATPAAPTRRPKSEDDMLFAADGAKVTPADPLAEISNGKGPTGIYRLGGDKKKGKKKRTAGGKNQWDSPLLLLGGGGLVVLLVAGAFLYFLMFRETADAVLNDANNLFKSGAYPQAIERYQDFVTRFSSHENASLARVQLEMSRVWQAAENLSDPAAALDAAQKAIAEIEDEPAFISGGDGEEGVSEAKRDLSALLVRIAQALVEQAESSDDPAIVKERVKQIDTALALMANDKYVPESLRNVAEISAMQESLAVIASRQRREGDLAAALAAMDEALADGDTAAAYAARSELLASYPALADDESLEEKVREATAAEQGRVEFVPGDRAAETAWPARPVVAELALADRRSAGGEAAGDPVVVRVDGALYGLASGNGALLWRRFAGLGETTAPVMLEGGGVAAADLRGGELWRLEPATGKLVWRLSLGEKLTGVVPAGPNLLAASESGKLYVVDATSGGLAGHVEFSQPIRTAPEVDDRGQFIYVVAEHSIIYSLSATDFSCLGVYYLGHAPGAIVAPPATVLNKVVVAENLGDDTCRIRVLAADESGAVAGETASDRLTGRVATPLARAARRLTAATTLGQLAVFEISGAEDDAALSVVARREGQGHEHLARFGLLQGGNLWIAGRQLMKLAVLPTENELSVTSLQRDYQGDAFDAPLMAVGDLVIHVRRPAGRAGAVVGATSAASGAEAWATEIAVPLAGAPATAEPLQLSAVTASGAAYRLDRDAMVRGVDDRALRASVASVESTPLTESVDLGDGRMAAAAVGSKRVLLFRPNDLRQPLLAVDLASPLTCPPVAWRGDLLAATEVGQVFLIDGETGEGAVTPFQPELTADGEYRWLQPAVVGSGEASQFVVSDGAASLHLVELAAEPTPHLAAVESVDVGATPLASPLAVAGSNVFAGTDDGRLAAFALPELTPAEFVELGGRVVWGPHPVADGLLMATDAGELILVGEDGAIRWQRKIDRGELGGKPLVDGDSALLLHVSGGLSRINLADGAEAGFADLGQPAVAGPVPLGERVVVGASDGALLVVNRPVE